MLTYGSQEFLSDVSTVSILDDIIRFIFEDPSDSDFSDHGEIEVFILDHQLVVLFQVIEFFFSLIQLLFPTANEISALDQLEVFLHILVINFYHTEDPLFINVFYLAGFDVYDGEPNFCDSWDQRMVITLRLDENERSVLPIVLHEGDSLRNYDKRIIGELNLAIFSFYLFGRDEFV